MVLKVSSNIKEESDRIAALNQLQIINTKPEEAFDHITLLASQICKFPISTISFTDGQRSCFKACVGLEINNVQERIGLFLSGLQDDEPVIIHDASDDPRIKIKGLTTGTNRIGFFACVPIISGNDTIVGHLSVMDHQPGEIQEQELSALQMLAGQVAALLKLRLLTFKLEHAKEEEKRIREERSKIDHQRDFYEKILNTLPIDIAVFDVDHKYLFVNPGAIKGEEYRKFIIGKDDFQYCEYRNRDISLAEIRRSRFLEVKRQGKEIRWEDTVKDPQGVPITSLRRFFPVYNDSGVLTMVIGFGLDISDRKIMEEKQNALVKQLSAQNTQLVDFCNIVSHNLRAPLVNMSMLVEFIEEGEDEAEQKLLISKLNPVLNNLHTTFNELVESIQIRQDHEITSESVALDDCLQRTMEVLKTEINKSNAVIEANFEEAKKIYFPSKYLFSIFHNLISNALKYQSPYRKPEIKIEAKRANGTVTLSVKDNGLGIDMAKHKDSIFKIGKVFHRHPNAKGFGLFMTRTQVEAMDGRIWVESMPDIGSTFYVEFKNQDS
jgi:signal transduction histidine kinase